MSSDPEIPVVDRSNDPPPANTCSSCGSESIEPAYKKPLCAPCRTTLANRPIPPLIIMIAGVLLAIDASFKYPAALRVAVANDRASHAEAVKDYATAEKQLLIVTRAYPNYGDGLVSLAQDSYNAGDYSVTADTLDKLNGRAVSTDQANQVNAIQDDPQKKSLTVPPSAGARL